MAISVSVPTSHEAIHVFGCQVTFSSLQEASVPGVHHQLPHEATVEESNLNKNTKSVMTKMMMLMYEEGEEEKEDE